MLNKLLLLIIITVLPFTSFAEVTSDWDVNWGATALNYKYGSEINDTLESSSVLEINYNLNASFLQSALNLSFTEVLSGGGKQIPYTRAAIGSRYFFKGINGERIVYDSNISGKIWRPTPFITFNLGLSNLSVEGFNASFLDLGLRGGVEVPLAANILLIGQVGYSGSLGSSSAASVSYNGLTLFAGLRFAEFE